MSNVPIVIIANKQDLPRKSYSFSFFLLNKNIFSSIDAMKPSEILSKLDMNNLPGKHKWYVQSACAITGEGLMESMVEMANLVKQYRKENK
jgi:hypothetical protein